MFLGFVEVVAGCGAVVIGCGVVVVVGCGAILAD